MTTGRTLNDVRRELRRARLANIAAAQIALRNWWRPALLWRALQFWIKNRRRRLLLQRLVDLRMGFAWRSSLPRKKQRRLGLLPPLNPTHP